MATPMRLFRLLSSNPLYLHNSRKSDIAKLLKRCSRLSSTQAGSLPQSRDPGRLFLNNEVQGILRRLTGFDINKIFATRPTSKFGPPKYELMTDEELKMAQDAADALGQERLQMPPVLKAWDTDSEVISEDPEIEGFHSEKFVFTDITYGLPRRSRMVVIREPTGVLRTANSEERDRILQVYFPQPGRMYQVPELFGSETLETVLSEGRYEYVLDHTCVQFEPDDPEYIRVTQRTYEHINSTGSYETLHSTRHYGPMVFCFAYYRNIDGIVVHLIKEARLDDAAEVVKLYHILNPEVKSAEAVKKQTNISAKKLIMTYAQEDSQQAGQIELALQSLQDNVAAASS